MKTSAKRLVFLIESMQSRGGMERVTASVASGLAERGFEVEIVTLHGDSSAFPLDPAIRLSSLDLQVGTLRLRGETPSVIRALRRHLVRNPPGTLITVDSFLSVFAFPALLGFKTRRVAWEHFQFFTDLGMRSRRLARRVAAHLGNDVITLTEQDARQWRRAFPTLSARLHTIPNPLPFAKLSENPYSLSQRVVLSLGRLDSQKGFDLLLEAWASVEDEFPDWSLRVFGNGTEEQTLRAQAERLRLKRWQLESATSRVTQEYMQAGIYALSSRHEGLPMVLVESQAYGVPAVAFDCPHGPADVLSAGGGLLIPAGEISTFAAALRRLMSENDLRRELSEQAIRGSGRYDASRILDCWSEFLSVDRKRDSQDHSA